MKKTLLMLLVVIMIFSVVAYAGVAYAKNNAGYSGPAVSLDDAAFTQMAPQEQYEYLTTLGSEEEINQLISQLSDEQLELLLSTLNDEQLALLEKYLTQRALDADAFDTQGDQPDESQSSGEEQDTAAMPSEEPSPSEAQSGDKDLPETSAEEPAVGETAPAPEDASAEEPAVDYSAMTPQELYDYLSSVENDEEIERIISSLPPEQYAVYQAFLLTQAESEQAPAVDYTHAALLCGPVEIVAPKTAKMMAAASASVPGSGQDGLMVNKTVTPENGSYLLNIEAYATGAVTVTPGQPIPADIILVLDTSLSMDEKMSTEGYTLQTNVTNEGLYSDSRGKYYVKKNNQYYALTITRGNGSPSGRIYTYRYTIGTTPYTSTSTGNNARPPSDLEIYKYTQGTTSRINALIAAANNFIDSIGAKASAGISHRIAVVTYSTQASILSGNKTTNGAFVNAGNQTQCSALKTSISNLHSVEYTSADEGLALSSAIFRDDLLATGGSRNRVVVFFTDGAPSRWNAGAYQEEVAQLAIAQAKTLKAPTTTQSGRGATIYSIGIFDGANPAIPIDTATVENRFMHLVSSNYKYASSMSDPGSEVKEGYYLSASSAGGLNQIFQAISDNIETGGTSVTLDATSVIKDVIAPYFELPIGVTERDIHVFTSSINENSGLWGDRQEFEGSVAISSDRRSISVSGFNYKENYYAVVKESGQPDKYKGKKLIIEIPIAYITNSCIGGLLPTNLGNSGIYDHDKQGNEVFVKALPIPTVPIPVQYDFTPVDRSVYLLQSARLSDLFTDAQSYYVPNGTNNAFVKIEYTVRDAENNLLGTYTIPRGEDHGTWDPADPALTGLTDNGIYTIDCTVTPNSTEITPACMTKEAHVYVFKLEVTYRDSTIYLGETADYSDNFVQTKWKNGETNVLPQSGSEPVLSFSYSPAEGAFQTDTYVNAAVSINNVNVTGHTTFVHDPPTGGGFDPAKGEFIVYVKSCSLKVTKTGAVDETDTFVFTIINASGLEIKITMQGNGSQTIVGLPVGEYTVTEVPQWSWRYAAGSETVTLSSVNNSDEVRIVNNIEYDKWLSGDDRAANLFDGSR